MSAFGFWRRPLRADAEAPRALGMRIDDEIMVLDKLARTSTRVSHFAAVIPQRRTENRIAVCRAPSALAGGSAPSALTERVPHVLARSLPAGGCRQVFGQETIKHAPTLPSFMIEYLHFRLWEVRCRG